MHGCRGFLDNTIIVHDIIIRLLPWCVK